MDDCEPPRSVWEPGPMQEQLNCVVVIIKLFLDHIIRPVGSSRVDFASRTSYGASHKNF